MSVLQSLFYKQRFEISFIPTEQGIYLPLHAPGKDVSALAKCSGGWFEYQFEAGRDVISSTCVSSII